MTHPARPVVVATASVANPTPGVVAPTDRTPAPVAPIPVMPVAPVASPLPEVSPAAPKAAVLPVPEAPPAPALSEAKSPTPRERDRSRRTTVDDIYVTRSAGQYSIIRVVRLGKDGTLVGTYHTRDLPTGDHWAAEAILTAVLPTRTGSMVRLHTNDKDIMAAMRLFRERTKTHPSLTELSRHLNQMDKLLVIARPERELPIWRSMLDLMQRGEMPEPTPLVTYVLHTAAFTDYENVYYGVVIIGQGQVVVHSGREAGDDLVTTELNMVTWALEFAQGGGRIDVHHSSDGALRIWEQRDVLVQAKGEQDPLASTGERLRTLLRTAIRLSTIIQPAKRPHPVYNKFARAAAGFAFAEADVL
ncbi:hypothetical protein [Deinococcus aquatilis]|uniref:hypothetical protein n=1 Tax=Deinococcus aquatilis TaxID=519440 RepID=UPI00039D3250|nr:hypothetical protein [Deinococcus aquatilis]